LVEALRRFVPVPVFNREHLLPLIQHLAQSLEAIEDVQCLGSPEHRLANTLSFVVRGTDSIALLANLDLEGVCASSGSACSAGSLEPSHVVRALGVEPECQNSLVRFSLGKESSLAQVQHVERIMSKVVRSSRQRQ
jgi:cysteine desulfurase